jgi:hypothetical protein
LSVPDAVCKAAAAPRGTVRSKHHPLYGPIPGQRHGAQTTLCQDADRKPGPAVVLALVGFACGIVTACLALAAWAWVDHQPQRMMASPSSSTMVPPSTQSTTTRTAVSGPPRQALSAPSAQTKVANAAVTSPQRGASVAACATFTGEAQNLPAQHTLVLAVIDSGSGNRLRIQPVNRWQKPSSLRSWSASQPMKGSTSGQRVEVRLVTTTTAAVRKALASSADENSWTADELPPDADVLQRIVVTVNGKDSCPTT